MTELLRRLLYPKLIVVPQWQWYCLCVISGSCLVLLVERLA